MWPDRSRRLHAADQHGRHACDQPGHLSSLPFDPVKDFTLITNLVNLPSLLIVHPSVPAASARS